MMSIEPHDAQTRAIRAVDSCVGLISQKGVDLMVLTTHQIEDYFSHLII